MPYSLSFTPERRILVARSLQYTGTLSSSVTLAPEVDGTADYRISRVDVAEEDGPSSSDSESESVNIYNSLMKSSYRQQILGWLIKTGKYINL